MATTKVYAPNREFAGEIAGVVFKDGVGEVDAQDNPAAFGYFNRHAFGIGKRPQPAKPDAEAERELRELTTSPHRVVAPLRDAAVDPKPEDFLAPINAGKANPHGPKVVSPEIHASGPAGIRPGEVHVDDIREQERAEKALAESVLINQEEHPTQPVDTDELARLDRGGVGLSDPGSAQMGAVGAPARSASQKAWASYAIAQGMDATEANDATRASLIERYGETE